MIYRLEHNTTIIDSLRRKWRKEGHYTVRVTCSGKVSVMRMPLHRDMKTEAQLKCRARFVEAQQLMLKALSDKRLTSFFRKRMLRKGYKTLRGCILAYYIDELLFKERQAELRQLTDKVSKCLADKELLVSREFRPSEMSFPSKRLLSCDILPSEVRASSEFTSTSSDNTSDDINIGDG